MPESFFDPNDPVFAALIDQFAGELHDRITAIESALAAGDTETLRRSGHQLKGAAASYGFGELTEPAHALQAACDTRASDEAIADAAGALCDACRASLAERAPNPVVG